MSMADRVDAALGSPVALEALYRSALASGEADSFAAEIVRRHAVAPADPLLAAWRHRLQPELAVTAAREPAAAVPVVIAPDESPARRRRWTLALLLSVALSLVYFNLSGSLERPLRQMFAWGPAAAVAIMLYLLLGRSRRTATSGIPFAGIAWARPVLGMLVLAAITVVAMLRSSREAELKGVDLLALIHLPALAWLTLGWVILSHRARTTDLFAAVLKSVEAVITAGLMAAAGLTFTIITHALFGAISMELPDAVRRYLFFGGPGLIPVLAVATVYDPDRSPSDQHGGQGFSRVIFTTGRLFLPLTLLVLAVYIVAIPFRFLEPFRNRDVLVIYNAMLFAVIALIVAVTPPWPGSLAPRYEALLRRGIGAVAALTLLVSVYAMTAVVYRALQGGLTMNRLTVIGWNTVNIAMLSLLLYRQARDGPSAWVEASHRTIRVGLVGYAIWTLFVLVGIPLIWSGPS